MNTAQSPAPTTTPPVRLLFVDDEPQILEAVSMTFRRFDVLTATSGAAGLEKLRAHPDVAVVVSDMRMPIMNGAAFLTQAREVAPNAVRMLLTGQTDFESAVAAVNKGQLFRLLTKPCPRDDLRAAVDAAIAQHRLQTAERELLEQTVRGSIEMLVDVLALVNPSSFGRANRIKSHVIEIAAQLGITETWQLEVAALTSQLGYITLPDELSEKLEQAKPLTDDDRKLVLRAAEAPARLVAHIPRLETVRDILAHHVKPPRRVPTATGNARLVDIGAHLLRFAIDFDELETQSASTVDVEVHARADAYDAEVLAAYRKAREARLSRVSIVEIQLSALRPGMVLADDVRFSSGALLVARGYVVTRSFVERLANFQHGAIKPSVKIITQ